MPVEFASSADKHGIPNQDAVHAMLHAEGSLQLQGNPGRLTTVYVGRPHPQTDRRIEVIAEIRQPDTVVIFHVMEVSDLYRHLIKETP